MRLHILSIILFFIAACSSQPKTESDQTSRTPGPQPASVSSATTSIIAPTPSNYEMKVSGRSFMMDGYQIPLHNSENIPAEEPDAIKSLNDIMIAFFKKQYASGGPTKDPATGLVFQGTRRGVHPRSHGCFKGKLEVNPQLQKNVGIFQKGASYDVTLRFSNGSPQISGDDRSIDTRGFAMKVHNVPGRHLLGDHAMISNETMSQDFTLNSSVPFFSDNAVRYRDFMKILSLEAPTLEDAGKRFIIQLLKQGHPLIAARVTNAFSNIRNVKVTNPLGISYYSITPFQHGSGPDADVVKYKVTPCRGEWQESILANDKFFLRTNLIKHLKNKSACFKFMIQERTNESLAVEDPSKTWSEKKSPFKQIATVQIPVQNPMDEMDCEKMIISPWNTIPEHKPLGGINRIRLPTYLMSVTKRRQTNHY